MTSSTRTSQRVHTSTRSPLRGLAAVALSALAALTLTGCGQTSPGVAVRIGDDSITRERVAEAASNVCAIRSKLGSTEGPTTMGGMQQVMLVNLLLASAAEQVGDRVGVGAGAAYEQALAAQRKATAQFDTEQAADFVRLQTSNDYLSGLAQAIGEAELKGEGIAKPRSEDAFARGVDEITLFLETESSEIDPRYGLDLEDGLPVLADTNTSAAFSDIAKAGVNQEPDPGYDLPASQRCE